MYASMKCSVVLEILGRIDKVFRRIIVMALLLAFVCSCALAESVIKTEDIMTQPSAIDDGYLVELFESYLSDSDRDDIGASLVDLDLNGIPELVVISDWAHMGLSGDIISYNSQTNDLCIHEDAAGCFGLQTKLALCIDGEGNICWYEDSFYAGCGMTSHEIKTVYFNSEMEMISNEWMGEFSKEVWDEATESVSYPITYYVYGEKVDEKTYKKEEATRRRLTVIYTYDPGLFSYPDDWLDACQQYSVIK